MSIHAETSIRDAHHFGASLYSQVIPNQRFLAYGADRLFFRVHRNLQVDRHEQTDIPKLGQRLPRGYPQGPTRLPASRLVRAFFPAHHFV